MPITAPDPALTKKRPPGLRTTLPGWLPAVGAAGPVQDGMVALFTSALRDIDKRRGGPADRPGAADGGKEGVA